MADEWSKPVKGPYGWSVDRGETRVGLFWDGDLVIRDDDYGSPTAPRDVVLRLLAAEASDRLGWVWEVDTGEWIASSGKSMWGRHAETGEPITYDDHFGFTADELLASLHGKFLLEDAMRKADLAEIEAENRAEREREYGAVEESNRRFEEEGP